MATFVCTIGVRPRESTTAPTTQPFVSRLESTTAPTTQKLFTLQLPVLVANLVVCDGKTVVGTSLHTI